MNSPDAPFRSVYRIPASHPCLPGHFPGTPLVPGVILLERVLQACAEHLKCGVRASKLEQVKFLAALAPEELADFELQLQGNRLAFRILRGSELIAQGRYQLELQEA